MKKNVKRLLSVALAVLMLFSVLPFSALADETASEPEIVAHIMENSEGELLIFFLNDLKEDWLSGRKTLFETYNACELVGYVFALANGAQRTVDRSAAIKAYTDALAEGKTGPEASAVAFEEETMPATFEGREEVKLTPVSYDRTSGEVKKDVDKQVEVKEDGTTEVEVPPAPGSEPTDPTPGADALAAAMAAYSALVEADYTAESWAVLAEAVAVAATTDAEMGEKAVAIMDAIDALVEAEPTEPTPAELAIAAANAALAALNNIIGTVEAVTEENYVDINAALNGAKTALAGVAGIDEYDSEGLEAAIAQVQALIDAYTDENPDLVAIEAANAALADYEVYKESTELAEEDVEAAQVVLDALDAAITGLAGIEDQEALLEELNTARDNLAALIGATPGTQPQDDADAALEALKEYIEVEITAENYEEIAAALEAAEEALLNVAEDEEYDATELEEAIAAVSASIEAYINSSNEAAAVAFKTTYATILALETQAQVDALTHTANYAIVALYEGNAEAEPAVPSFEEAYAALEAEAAALVVYPTEGEGKFADIEALIEALDVRVPALKAEKVAAELAAARAAFDKALTTPNKINLDAVTGATAEDAFAAIQGYIASYQAKLAELRADETSAIAAYVAAQATADKATQEQLDAAVAELKAMVEDVNVNDTLTANKKALDAALVANTTFDLINKATGTVAATPPAKNPDHYAISANNIDYRSAVATAIATESSAIKAYVDAQKSTDVKATVEQYNAAIEALKKLVADVNYTKALSKFQTDNATVLALLTATIVDFVSNPANTTAITKFVDDADPDSDNYVGDAIIEAVNNSTDFATKASLFSVDLLLDAIKSIQAVDTAFGEVVSVYGNVIVENELEGSPYDGKIAALKVLVEDDIANADIDVDVAVRTAGIAGREFTVKLTIGYNDGNKLTLVEKEKNITASFISEATGIINEVAAFESFYDAVLALKTQANVTNLTSASTTVLGKYNGDSTATPAVPGFKAAYGALTLGAKEIVDTNYVSSYYANIDALIAAMDLKMVELNALNTKANELASRINNASPNTAEAVGNVVTVTGNVTLNANITVDDKVELVVESGATLTIARNFTLTVEKGGKLTANSSIVMDGNIRVLGYFYDKAWISRNSTGTLRVEGPDAKYSGEIIEATQIGSGGYFTLNDSGSAMEMQWSDSSTLNERIFGSVTLAKDWSWAGNGTLTVKNGAALTVSAGKTFGIAATNTLAIEDGGTLKVVGTATFVLQDTAIFNANTNGTLILEKGSTYTGKILGGTYADFVGTEGFKIVGKTLQITKFSAIMSVDQTIALNASRALLLNQMTNTSKLNLYVGKILQENAIFAPGAIIADGASIQFDFSASALADKNELIDLLLGITGTNIGAYNHALATRTNGQWVVTGQ